MRTCQQLDRELSRDVIVHRTIIETVIGAEMLCCAFMLWPTYHVYWKAAESCSIQQLNSMKVQGFGP